jgi:hypothetical protein
MLRNAPVKKPAVFGEDGLLGLMFIAPKSPGSQAVPTNARVAASVKVFNIDIFFIQN